MSLINDALLSLDAARDEAQSVRRSEYASSGEIALRVRPLVWLTISVLACSVLLGSGLATWVFFEKGYAPSASPEALPALLSNENDLPVSALISSPAAMSEKKHDQTAELRSAVSEATQENNQENNALKTQVKNSPVHALLQQADLAINQGQLSLPENASALYFLQRALQLEPDNQAALQKIQQVKTRYMEKIDTALRDKNIQRAEFLLSRAGYFPVTESERLALQAQLAALQQSVNSAPIEALAVEKKANTAWVKKTLLSEDLKQRDAAQRLILQGKTALATDQLATWSKLTEGAIHSPLLLVELYLAQQRITELLALLDKIPEENPARIILQAKIAALNADEEQAIQLLENKLPGEQTHIYHHELLAGLYQNRGKYRAAKQLYQQLLLQDTDNIKFLLGFALAADSLGDKEEAFFAYSRVLKKGHSNPDVMHFAEKRVQVLSAAAGSAKAAVAVQ